MEGSASKNSERSQATSNDGCPKCSYTGTLNTFKWVQPEGYPIPYQVATVELCDCHYERQFRKYNATETFTPKEKEYTFKNAIIDDSNIEQYTVAIDFVKNIKQHMEDGMWLYIFGDEIRVSEVSKEKGFTLEAYGTGKTFMMQCMANAFSHRRIPAIYVTEESLFGDIKATYDKGSEESEHEILNRYYNVPILMIDDIFTAPYKEWAEGKLFSILDERQKKNKVTIMTSNYALGRISQRLPLNGGKIASRIKGQSILIEMIGPDRRENKRTA
ncbi:DnaA ATPase domain-containing protein [Paenibacillus lactis]|uniref:DnaA ATPase domain-containing protein n=1 Tax=Paenibacillus lactis TaxID=228574 RepID=UPI0036B6D1E1